MSDLNKMVGTFNYKDRAYEIDRLLDSYDKQMGGYVYDLFDVTEHPDGESIVQIGLSDELDFLEMVDEFEKELEEISKNG